MKKKRHVAAMVIAAVLVGSAAGGSFGAAAGKGLGSQHGKGGEHKNAGGRANGNGQWFADPERGWVRVDEKDRLEDQKELAEKHRKGPQKKKSTKAYR